MLMMATKPSDPENEPALWNAADVATYLGMHQSTVWTHEAEGLIPQSFKLGHRTRWRKSDIVRFVECGCDMREWRRRK